MHGNRIVNRQFQTASLIFNKGKQKLTLQGMIHWGTGEFFQKIQGLINQCNGIILMEDTHYLDPADLVKLNDEDFNQFCKMMKGRTNKTLEMMGKLLNLKYQWDVLKYPGPPHALCADTGWHEMNEFNKYSKATAKETGPFADKSSTREKTWDLLIKEDKIGSVLLSEIIHQCFKKRGSEKKGGKTKERLMRLFEKWNEHPGFKNAERAREVFQDLIDYYGSGDPDHEPEDKAFWFDKREQRVFKLVEKIEKLDYIDEILIIYGSGHFEALAKGLKRTKWKPTEEIMWNTPWIFPSYSIKEMMQALDSITQK